MADPGPEADAAIQRRIIELGLDAAISAAGRRPLAWLVAGPPGSGKARLAEEAAERSFAAGGSPVRVDGDRFRIHHPDYARLATADLAEAFDVSQPFSSRWADGLRDAAVDRGLDVVVEGLFKTRSTTAAFIDRLVASRYEVGLLAKLIPAAVSLLQIECRYERLSAGLRGRESAPRRVDAVSHDVGYRALGPLVALFEERGLGASISLRDIDGAPLPVPADGATWSSVVEKARASGLTDRDRAFCLAVLSDVLRFRVARRAPADPEPGSALEAALALLAV